MDYIKEIVEILENNKIKHLPSIELISQSEDIALAVWKNFVVGGDYYGYYDFNDWYIEGNWKEKLKSYSENVKFWEKAIEICNNNFDFSDFLLNKEFQIDFPIIKNYFLSNNEKLAEYYNKNGNEEYLELSTLSKEEKDILYKKKILNNPSYLSIDTLRKYENDEVFITSILEKNPNTYNNLNDINKLNEKFIELAFKNKNFDFVYIPAEKQDKYFPLWLENHVNDRHVLSSFKPAQRKAILEVRPDLFLNMSDKDLFKDSDIAIKVIQNDIFNIRHFSLKQIDTLFKELSLDKIKPQLLKYAQEYSNTQEISKTENKIFALIKMDKEITKTLKNNIFYQLNTMIPDSKIIKATFDGYVDIIIDKVENHNFPIGKADSYLGRLKNKLPVEILKEEKYPSTDIYKYIIEKNNANSNNIHKKLKM